MTVEPCPRNRSECYLELLPRLTAQRVELLDDARVLRQLLSLERRAGRLREVVDHPPGQHDDVANAAAIALLAAQADAPYLVDLGRMVAQLTRPEPAPWAM